MNNLIFGPVITEKTLAQQSKGYYTLWVSGDANKTQIASAFLNAYNTKPIKINIINLKGKTKTDWKKRTPIQKPDRKKAIIFIGKDKKIESLGLKQK
jgi:ribosomal protein L23